MPVAVDITNLSRSYTISSGVWRRRSRVLEAVTDLSLQLEEGKVLGLLGPNGAGKTTIIKILTTVLLPTSGTVRVLGHDVVTETRAVRRRIGYVFDGERGFYLRMSARDNLNYFADLYGLSEAVKRRRVPEVLDLVGLTGRESDRVERFSRGMRQRLHIARGILHDPPVVIMDEPTTGLDPVGAREVRQLVGTLAGMGKTILLSTHYMFEADSLCDEVVVLRRGRAVASGSTRNLKERIADRTVVEIEVYGVAPEAIDRLRDDPVVAAVSVDERAHVQTIQVQTPFGNEKTGQILAYLPAASIGRVSVREPTLEDAYLDLVDRLDDR